MKNEVVISSAKRTAVASLGKTLKNVSAHELGSFVINETLKNQNFKKKILMKLF